MEVRKDSPRENLFSHLRELTPPIVARLVGEYTALFPARLSDDYGATLSGETVEGLTFEPDRLIAMCHALKDALFQVAEIEDGPIYVVEAGSGIGYVALAALAWNEALQNRVKVISIEKNPDLAKRQREVFEYFEIPKDWYVLLEDDATKFDGVPPNTHILVAEHVCGGGFARKEPLYDIHQRLIPQLAEPKFIIPNGVDFHLRVVPDGFMDIEEELAAVRANIKKLMRAGVLKLPPDFMWQIPTSKVEQLAHLGENGPQRLLLNEQRVEEIVFASLGKPNGWEGGVDLQWHRGAIGSGEGILQSRIVPTFHTDGFERALLPRQVYAFPISGGADLRVIPGTVLNMWMPVYDNCLVTRRNARIAAEVKDQATFAHRIAQNAPECFARGEFERGRTYAFRAVGDLHANGPKVLIAEGPEMISLMP